MLITDYIITVCYVVWSLWCVVVVWCGLACGDLRWRHRYQNLRSTEAAACHGLWRELGAGSAGCGQDFRRIQSFTCGTGQRMGRVCIHDFRYFQKDAEFGGSLVGSVVFDFASCIPPVSGWDWKRIEAKSVSLHARKTACERCMWPIHRRHVRCKAVFPPCGNLPIAASS